MAKPVGPYTPAVKAGPILYCSGQIGLRDGQLVDGFEAQARQALHNLQALLQENGLDLEDLTKTTVFVTDMGNYDAMNEIYIEVLGEHRPARSAIGVASLPKGALFEVEGIAHG